MKGDVKRKRRCVVCGARFESKTVDKVCGKLCRRILSNSGYDVVKARRKIIEEGKIGAIIRHWRLSRGLSQVDLARISNTAQKRISAWELGRCIPSFTSRIKINETTDLDLPLQTKTDLDLDLQTKNARSPLSKAILQWRKNHHLTRSEAVAEIGVHYSTLCAWETEETKIPRHDNIMRLKNAGVAVSLDCDCGNYTSVKKLRIKNRLTLEQMGKMLSVTRQRAQQIETTPLNAKTIRRLARAFGVNKKEFDEQAKKQHSIHPRRRAAAPDRKM